MLIAQLLIFAALGCLAGTLGLLWTLGPRYRVARLLAATPSVSIEEARALANGRPNYVKLTGRISSDEEFPDEHDRPLVFRRKRIETGGPGRWRTVADEREAVPFGVEARDVFIGVDSAAIGVGLVAIPREATGRLADLPADLGATSADSAPDTPARLLIEQLSAVEHATVCGTPVLRDGQPTMTAGTGRPLIVTTLEVPAAMRLLAAGGRLRVVLAAGLLGAAAVCAAIALIVFVAGS